MVADSYFFNRFNETNHMRYFKDYTTEVVSAYYKNTSSASFTTRLGHLTPANVKKECIAVCTERFTRQDERVLRDLFGQNDEKEGYIKAIKRCSIDKFRPLINYIKKESKDTAEVNIELLAWLIDFKPRPFEVWKKAEPAEKKREELYEGVELSGTLTGGGGNIIKEAATLDKTPKTIKEGSGPQRKWILFLVPVLLLAVIGFLSIKEYKFKKKMDGSANCMYWNKDHYERISCVQRNDTLVIPFDQKVFSDFHRILNTDTVTERSIGNLWYRKQNKKLELYTSPGNHPIDIWVRLRRLNKYMYDKYLAKRVP
jgi:hypothetical protein